MHAPRGSAAPSIPPQLKTDGIIIPNSDMPKDAEIGSVNYQKYPALFLKILMGNQVWLTNEGEKEVNLQEGFIIAGFGPGKFKEAITDKDKNYHMFKIEAPDVNIMHGTKLRTVYDMIKDWGVLTFLLDWL